MQTRLIRIGNSYGIRLPKSVIKQLNLDKSNLEIMVKDEGILITAVPDVPPLDEWDQLFKKARKNDF
jgi:antitoxin component of MazEF toxin-antitoxin module